ncbi:MAG: flagellar protein FlaG [Cycloclasticus sp.]|jgi:Uncharacterized flagellar protein FlaG
MSDIKADTGRAEILPRSTLSTESPENVKVQIEVKAAEKTGKVSPEGNVVKVAQEADIETVENAVSKLNEYVQSTARTLNFQVDDESGKTVIKVYDRESEKLIRQIPNELVLELARRLNEEEPSLLFEAQV